jgi:hypothetical protein
VTTLKQSDVVLLQDGKPRPFTIFDAPDSANRMPVEVAVLFDTTLTIPPLWDPVGVFKFISHWDDGESSATLKRTKDQGEVRISVYRFFGQKLYRIAPATTDPQVVTKALQSILFPIPLKPEPGSVIALSIPPGREVVAPGPFTNEYVTSPFFGGERRGWTMESAIGLLNDVSARQDPVSHVLVMFSQGVGSTTTVPEDVGNQALDVGIPIYPVAVNYNHQIQSNTFPRNYFRMHEFEALGKMTGGRSFEYDAIDGNTLRSILTGVVGDMLAQYVVGFVPSSGDGGRPRQHRLEVRLSSKSLGAIEGGKRRAVYQRE